MLKDENNIHLADECTKMLLAQGLGVRLLYCQRCEVVELEIGAFTLKLSPQSVQRIANVMMKASLKLDSVLANIEVKNKAQAISPAPRLLH